MTDVPPLIHALIVEDREWFRRTLEAGSDVNVRDRDGRTALHQAVVNRDVEAVASLIAHDIDVNAPDNHGVTALHFAAQEFAIPETKLLLGAGATVDPTDQHGNTPLCRATFNSRGRGELIRLLLDSGANPDHQNNNGVSPRKLAKTIGNFDVVEFFSSR